jgi:uncharacterized protein
MADRKEIANDERCVGCGACCWWLTVPPDSGNDAIDDAWWESLPEALQEEINATEGWGKPCVWLDQETRRCKHYDLRPQTCRLFEPGCDVCEEDRAALLWIGYQD